MPQCQRHIVGHSKERDLHYASLPTTKPHYSCWREVIDCQAKKAKADVTLSDILRFIHQLNRSTGPIIIYFVDDGVI